MKRFFPALCIGLFIGCVLSVLPRVLDVFVLLEAIMPMVIPHKEMATHVAFLYMFVILVPVFLAGVFLTMAFTVRLADKPKADDN